MARMTDREILLEQARILRSLAASFDAAGIQDDLRRLAARCDALAKRPNAPKPEDRPA